MTLTFDCILNNQERSQFVSFLLEFFRHVLHFIQMEFMMNYDTCLRHFKTEAGSYRKNHRQNNTQRSGTLKQGRPGTLSF